MVPILKKLIMLAFPLGIYLLFYSSVVFGPNYFGGSDAENYYYPSRYYLWDSLQNGKFPLWTEKIFSGYPIFADTERSYLNPINIVSILLFGPYSSYTVLHFLAYSIGVASFIVFLKRKQISDIGCLVSITLYYFSFFYLYHQQHFALTLTCFLYPLGILLADLYCTSSKFKYAVLLALLTSLFIYIGSFQFVTLFIFLLILYFGANQLKLTISTLKHFTFGVFLTVALTAPQVFPTLELYLHSERGQEGVSYTQGSYNPLMLVNLVYPAIFGVGDNYKWNTVNDDYFIQETYIYAGIVGLILGLAGLLVMPKGKLRTFLVVFIFGFLILGFMRFIPLLDTIPIPFFALFRYWGRSVILFVLAISISAGYFVTNLALSKFKTLHISKPVLIFIVLFGVELGYSLLISNSTGTIITQIKNRAIELNSNLYLWIVLFGLTLMLVLISSTVSIKKYIKGILLVLVVADLAIFGKPVTNSYLSLESDLYNDKLAIMSKNYPNQRIIYASEDAYFNKGLYLASWGIFEYSQLTPLDLPTESFQRSNFKKLSFIPDSKALNSLGVLKLVDSTGNELAASTVTSIVQNFDGSVEVIKQDEGAFTFKIVSSKEQQLNTYVRNYPGWKVYINGKSVPMSTGHFINFSIPPGELLVRITYTPVSLYIGVVLTFGLLIVLGVYLRKTHFKGF